MADRPLNLLLVSYTLPRVGGLETMTRLVAREFSRQGRVVTRIVTPTPGHWDPGLERVSVHRRPGLAELHGHFRWADVVFFNHFHLRQALPLLWMPAKPLVLSISGYTPPRDITHLKHRMTGWVLQGLLRRADAVIACNEWCQGLLPVPATIVPNPYDEERFTGACPVDDRPGDLLFAGRITHAKGVEELVEAYAMICRTFPREEALPGLTVAGEGVLEEPVRRRLEGLERRGEVHFTGPLAGDRVAGEMGRHRVLVVPSRYQEPVGIVALEGLASGCVVVGSRGGGLGETIGRFGFTFDNGDVSGLARALSGALALSGEERGLLLQGRERHLERYRAATVAQGYLRVISGVLPVRSRALLQEA